MTTEELQKTWQESGRIGSPYNPQMNSRRETALEKLMREYKRFSWIALAMTFVSIGLYNLSWLEMPWKVVIPLLFISFFATSSTMDHWLANGIRSIDCSRMSVREVIDRSLFYRRRHHQFMMILIPYAAVVLGCFGWASRAEIYLLAGMGAGFLVGLAIGIRKYLDFMVNYRDIESD
ncbi:MAG: hypothetical protein PUA94_06955 [Bacteroidales bacterium]|nr:hypothetical protein [Bacteroidales bacterium]